MFMEILAWIAAILVFTSFFMKTIVPLRVFAIASNVAFVGYAAVGVAEGLTAKVFPILVLHLALLPLNLIRLREIRHTISQIRRLPQGMAPYDFLIPYMKPVRRRAGEVLFKQGDRAADVYILRSGSVSLDELGKTLAPGTLFGEIAVFSEDAHRTATARCETDCELYVIAGERILELFYQDRKFAFTIARLLSGYA